MVKDNEFKSVYRENFAGGNNYYLGARQIKDNESPNAVNCDFKGQTGVGNRQGYTQIGTVTDSRDKIYGMAEFHTAALDQAIKFASNGTNVALGYSTGGAWAFETTVTLTDGYDVNCVQAGGKLYFFNGVDDMISWNGTVTASEATEGVPALYGEYFDRRLWGVDPANKDTLLFSVKGDDTTKPFSFTNNGTSSNKGSVVAKAGAGAEITGVRNFKNYLYIFLTDSIYRLSTTSTVNSFTIELVTNSVGCISHRSICQVGEDLFFASDDGVYSLGEVANYTSVRTTNKSARMQQVFDALSATNKKKLVGRFFNFKYHLFYSLFGTNNDSCLNYDVRYQGWQDWRNIAANDATLYRDGDGQVHLYFGEPTTGKTHELYSGSTDDGSAITSTWYSKSYDEKLPDVTKLYFDSTFVLGSLSGTVTISCIYNDTETLVTKSISQGRPQGGFGNFVFGRRPYGSGSNTTTVIQYQNLPLRLKSKQQKFAIQYKISSSGQWRLDSISQSFIPFNRFKFPSYLKLN
jgi:hypothetical protein